MDTSKRYNTDPNKPLVDEFVPNRDFLRSTREGESMTTNEIEELMREFANGIYGLGLKDGGLKEPFEKPKISFYVGRIMTHLLAYGEKEYLRGREDHIQEENCNCQCSACSDCGSTQP